MLRPDATLEFESHYFADFPLICGIDEVGRGALAGPVTVGLCVVDAGCNLVPAGLTDSKLIAPSRREKLVPQIEKWAVKYAVCDSSAVEVDRYGITGALRLAAIRGLACLEEMGIKPDLILLDGKHDWISSAPDLFFQQLSSFSLPPVITRVKADISCASVAAASVLAKVKRDSYMRELPDPGYDWSSNKGYASAAHVRALSQLGVSDLHRRSWKLPGIVN
ncbi:ribonuclease HII [Actinomycetaceae bacterium TAE3-ERU4]|nr:ribonuclease HII [Actinomycetaceae bacterium TAE3-ERU4]